MKTKRPRYRNLVLLNPQMKRKHSTSKFITVKVTLEGDHPIELAFHFFGVTQATKFAEGCRGALNIVAVTMMRGRTFVGGLECNGSQPKDQFSHECPL